MILLHIHFKKQEEKNEKTTDDRDTISKPIYI
jgi:hypothetical protein